MHNECRQVYLLWEIWFKTRKFGPIINYLLACVGCTGECAKFWKSLNRPCWAWSVLPQPQANIPQYSPHALFI